MKELLLLLLIHNSLCFWPPAYKIDLNQGENFIISDSFDENENDNDDEMIKQRDIEQFQVDIDEDKYFRIHKLAARKNNKPKENPFVKKTREVKKQTEIPQYGHDEPMYAGFFDKNGLLITDNNNVYYANEVVKRMVENNVKKKREETKKIEETVDYNYNAIKADYEELMVKSKERNDTVKYVEVKEDESVKEAVLNVIDFQKVPKNCTKEEENGIGMAAVECFFQDMSKTETREQKVNLAKKIGKLLLIWFCVYLTIALPCWCQRGWCCCCFRCKFCRPKETIEEAKTFLMNNPPGIFHENGKKISYIPTHYERYAQKKLEQAIMKL